MLIAAFIICGAHDRGAAAATATTDRPPVEFADLAALRQSAASCDNGTITLAWESLDDREPTVVLEQSATPEFGNPVVRYRGTDPGSVISGLAEGTHYFRVRDADAPAAATSSVLEVRVVFFSRTKLYLLLGTGGAVVLATLGTVVFGYRKTRREMPVITPGKETCHDG